jgi:hypothetical protein
MASGPINSSGEKRKRDPNYSNNFTYNNHFNNKILDSKSSFLSPNGTTYLNTLGSLDRNYKNQIQLKHQKNVHEK